MVVESSFAFVPRLSSSQQPWCAGEGEIEHTHINIVSCTILAFPSAHTLQDYKLLFQSSLCVEESKFVPRTQTRNDAEPVFILFPSLFGFHTSFNYTNQESIYASQNTQSQLDSSLSIVLSSSNAVVSGVLVVIHRPLFANQSSRCCSYYSSTPHNANNVTLHNEFPSGKHRVQHNSFSLEPRTTYCLQRTPYRHGPQK
jgi:hypothetical protein